MIVSIYGLRIRIGRQGNGLRLAVDGHLDVVVAEEAAGAIHAVRTGGAPHIGPPLFEDEVVPDIVIRLR